MRVYSPSFSSRLLVAVGVSALSVLAIVLITGGFDLRVGPVRFSAHRATGSLVIAAAALIVAALHGRAQLAGAFSSVEPFIERHAAAAGIVLAAAAAAAGASFGTYSASGADPSGYVSHAELLVSGHFSRDEPLAREVEWPEATVAFSPLGYRPGSTPGRLVPGYPLGLPMTMALPRLIGGETAAFLVTPLLGALLVFCAYRLGARLHSQRAGLIAAALSATSPIVLFQIVQPMSDVPAAAWWTLAFLCALSPGSGTALAAGAATGIAVLTRPNLLPLAAAVALGAAGWLGPKRERAFTPSRLWLFAAGLVPAFCAIGLLQWGLYGSPLTTSYGDVSEFFALSNIGTNVRDYAWRLWRGEGGSLGLAACALVGLVLPPRSAPGIARAAALAGLVLGLVLAIYLPYGVFPDWSYFRFLLPALPAVFVLVGAMTVEAAARLPAPSRGAVLLVAMATVCSFNIAHASREGSFSLQRYESRYRGAGRYLKAALPSQAVVVTSQQSGSVSHYTGLPIVRWDLVTVDIDQVLTSLTSRGRRPVLLIEDWEIPQFRDRFPGSGIAALDWVARAEFGDDTRVFLLDPADRNDDRAPRITDRVH